MDTLSRQRPLMEFGRVRRAGNSLVLTIPKEEAERLDLHDGDSVAYEIRKAELRPILTAELRSLADELIADNLDALRYLGRH
jgi:antitoxin component of MazEF toxin-antitoxin module